MIMTGGTAHAVDRQEMAPLGEQDVYLFREGTHDALYAVMGFLLGKDAATVRLWAPNASSVAVIGEWNGWDASADPLVARDDQTGIWEGAVRGVMRGQAYKYRIVTRDGGRGAGKGGA